MKIKKSLIFVLCLMMLVSVLPTGVFSAGIIENETANLTITYVNETTPIKGATFNIYRVADIDRYGAMTLTENFAESAVELKSHDASHWQNITEVLDAYVDLKKIDCDYSGKTDSNGKLTFSNVERGIYLVTGLKRAQNGRTYTPYPFMISLPTVDVTENEWVYSVDVKPKFKSEKDGGGGGSSYVSRKVMKVWEDDDYEHNRPKSISVVLLKDGEAYETVKLSEENNWKHEWTKLNDSYVWTIAEEEVPEGYKVSMTKTGSTYVITNTYTPDKDDDSKDAKRTVIKVWDDAGYEKERPNKIEAVLLKDGKEVETVELSEENNWKHEWTGLSTLSEWTVEEKNVPAGYKSKVTKEGVVYIITNTYTDEEETEPVTEPTEPENDKTEPKEHTTEPKKPEEKETVPSKDYDEDKENKKVTVSVHKVWDDGESFNRPQSVQIEILKDGMVYEEVTLSKDNSWQYSVADLPAESAWSVREANVPAGYMMSVANVGTTFVVTNTIIPPDVDMTVKKVWKDEGHEAERPKKIEFELIRNGEAVEVVALSEENGWQYTFTSLDGKASWSVREKTVLDKYTSKVVSDKDGFVIINTYSVIPQTGQLWWPVPMLLAIGFMLLCAGLIRRRGAK